MYKPGHKNSSDAVTTREESAPDERERYEHEHEPECRPIRHHGGEGEEVFGRVVAANEPGGQRRQCCDRAELRSQAEGRIAGARAVLRRERVAGMVQVHIIILDMACYTRHLHETSRSPCFSELSAGGDYLAANASLLFITGGLVRVWFILARSTGL